MARNVFTLRTLLLCLLCVKKKRDVFIVPKGIHTTDQNALYREVSIRKSSVPNKKLEDIFNILKLKHQPLRKRKSVVHKTTI